MSTKIFVLITSVGVVKVKKESNVVRMDVTNDKLQQYFQNLLALVENTSKTSEDSILLAGAMMSVARVVYYDVLGPHEGQHLMDANTVDLVELIKPTIH
jgi:hypothetical protein